MQLIEMLDADDYRRVLTAIEALGQDTGWDGFPSRVVEAVSLVLDADFVSFNEVDLDSGAGRFLLRPDLSDFDPGSREYGAFLRRFGTHPILVMDADRQGGNVPVFMRKPRLMAVGVGRCCGEAELRLSCGLDLNEAPSHLIGIGVSRAVRDFDRRDAARVDALRPHLLAACRLALRSRQQVLPAPKLPPVTERASPAAEDLPLTRRENEVLYWVAMGKTNEEIALILGAQPPTIKKHLEHIYAKLQVPNRTAAAMLVRASRPTAAV